MKAFLYDISIQSDPVHSYTKRMIKEVYIREYHLHFNRECVFVDDDGSRFKLANNIEEIELEDELVHILLDKVNNDKIIKDVQEKIFDSFKSDICKKCEHVLNDHCRLESSLYRQLRPDAPEVCPYKLEKIVIEQKEDDEKI